MHVIHAVAMTSLLPHRHIFTFHIRFIWKAVRALTPRIFSFQRPSSPWMYVDCTGSCCCTVTWQKAIEEVHQVNVDGWRS